MLQVACEDVLCEVHAHKIAERAEMRGRAECRKTKSPKVQKSKSRPTFSTNALTPILNVLIVAMPFSTVSGVSFRSCNPSLGAIFVARVLTTVYLSLKMKKS